MSTHQFERPPVERPMELLGCFPVPVRLDAVFPLTAQIVAAALRTSGGVPRAPGDEQAYPVAAVCTGGSLSFKSLQCYDAAVACASLSSLAVSRPCCEEDEDEQPSEAAPLPQPLDEPAGLASAQGGLVNEARRRETLPLQSQMSYGAYATSTQQRGTGRRSHPLSYSSVTIVWRQWPCALGVYGQVEQCKSRSCTQS